MIDNVMNKTVTKKIKFNHWTCDLVVKQYCNGGISLILMNAEGIVCIASVYICPLDPGLVAIKDYGENAGILDCFIKHKIVSKPIIYKISGYVRVPICRLLVGM